jgi:hypothetical protein
LQFLGCGLRNKKYSMTSQLQADPLKARSSSFPVMSVDSANWMAKKKRRAALISRITCDSTSWVLYTPTNSVIWHRDFQNSFFIFLAKHIFFTILQHADEIND